MLPLDQIDPKPIMPAPATRPTTPAPLDALDLYARGRECLLANQRYNGIKLLEKAIALDPDSFEPAYTLGRAYLSVGMTDKALESFLRAAVIKPENLDIQAELGRAYFNRGDLDRAIEHLRLARLTDDYAAGDVTAPVVDYRLAVALQRKGYDRAAMDVYEGLIKRLAHPSPQMRSNPEVAYLLAHPETLVQEVAQLYEKHGQADDALRAYRFVAERSPDDLAIRSKIAALLVQTGKGDEAVAAAGDAVRRFRASPESLALLRDTYHKLGREADMSRELRKLYAERPNDRPILFALADALESTGRGAEAETLLAREAEQRGGTPGGAEILARLVELYTDRGQPTRAAKLLVESAAKNPDASGELSPQWWQLVRPGRRDALRIEQMRDLAVDAEAQAAKWFYVRRVAQAWSREMPARDALDRAVQAQPLFPPAIRAKASEIWAEAATPESAKIEKTKVLIDACRAAAHDDLADELDGMILLGRKQADEAIKALTRATQSRASSSPEAQFALAAACRTAGNNSKFEQILWRMISDHPRIADPYAALFRYYLEQGQLNGARRVLSVWRVGMPENVESRLLEATLQLRISKQRDEAERSLLAIARDNADDPEVLANLRAFYTEVDRLPKFIELLEEEVVRRPHNYVAVAQLVDVYASGDRKPDATRVLDATRQSISGDADRLYLIAHLYDRVDQPQMVEQVLLDVLRIDPAFAPAGNDLGYTWADAGQNLERAESLVRRALQEEPDNPMFLDSLGWVMYKRGQFDDARRHLEQAVAAQNFADPVVLDHLGDVLYRLHENTEALKQWQQSLAKLGEMNPKERDEVKNLRLQLNQKLKQAQAGEPVNVAPVVEDSPTPKQAKN